MTHQGTKPKANIDNIYYDCLERIFDFLDLKDLLKVAKTCKRLQIAAAAKFSEEHGKKRIILTDKLDFVGRSYGMRVGRDEIVINYLKFQLSFLRCFGSKISHLNFDMDGKNNQKTIIDQYINRYCADTLSSMVFRRKLVYSKPFKSVEKLTITDLNSFPEFLNWYPNLRHLDILYVDVMYVNVKIQPIETLEKLVIREGHLAHNFPNFVNWYPNLRHLELHDVYIDTDYVAVCLPHLEHLGITMCLPTIVYIGDLLNANLQLQSLDVTVINSSYISTNLAVLLNMICTHRSISKIKVTLQSISSPQISAAELLQLTNEHPKMTELNLQQYQFTPDDALTLIGRLKSLKRFEFYVENEHQCNRIQNQLNDDWQFNYRRAKIRFDDPDYIIVLDRK